MDTLEDIDRCLSELGMLSEVCLADITEEEKELLCNKGRLASISTEKRKEREKKEQEKARKNLQNRRAEAESVTHIYKCRPVRDRQGNKVTKCIWLVA